MEEGTWESRDTWTGGRGYVPHPRMFLVFPRYSQDEGRYLGILDKGGYMYVTHLRMIPGWGKVLENPGMLGRGGMSPIPRCSQDGGRYLGIPGYLDKRGGMLPIPG